MNFVDFEMTLVWIIQLAAFMALGSAMLVGHEIFHLSGPMVPKVHSEHLVGVVKGWVVLVKGIWLDGYDSLV